MRVELLTPSATELARQLRDGTLTSREVVDAHIERIEQTAERINAVVATRFVQARQEADAADVQLAAWRAAGKQGELPPYLGVPCTIKESFSFAGMPNTSGLKARVGVLPTEDAPTVARLRAAGAIPLGVTNTSELCMWLESNNQVYGRTNNPYDPGRMVGGSSGGEGAIVGAGASPFGLGADVGGSIRLPSFFNGIFGHKPSSGVVPSSKQWPPCSGKTWWMLSTGPMCRRAEDLMPLLRILAGPDGHDPSTEVRELGDPGTVKIAGMTVKWLDNAGLMPPEPAQRQAVQRATKALAGLGATVSKAKIPGIRNGFSLWSARLSLSGSKSFHQLLGYDGQPPNLAKELAKWTVKRSSHTLPALGLAALEKLPINPGSLEPVMAQVAAMRKAIEDQLGDNGVLILPTFPRTAPRHYWPILSPLSAGYTGVFNALELPVTQVPTGLDAEGIPTGIQVVGRHGEDHVTIAVAMALEQALGGWVPPWRSPNGV
jgi:fatty acid amide hydrolase 2